MLGLDKHVIPPNTFVHINTETEPFIRRVVVNEYSYSICPPGIHVI
jgi:hypothetical protein